MTRREQERIDLIAGADAGPFAKGVDRKLPVTGGEYVLFVEPRPTIGPRGEGISDPLERIRRDVDLATATIFPKAEVAYLTGGDQVRLDTFHTDMAILHVPNVEESLDMVKMVLGSLREELREKILIIVNVTSHRAGCELLKDPQLYQALERNEFVLEENLIYLNATELADYFKKKLLKFSRLTKFDAEANKLYEEPLSKLIKFIRGNMLEWRELAKKLFGDPVYKGPFNSDGGKYLFFDERMIVGSGFIFPDYIDDKLLRLEMVSGSFNGVLLRAFLNDLNTTFVVMVDALERILDPKNKHYVTDLYEGGGNNIEALGRLRDSFVKVSAVISKLIEGTYSLAPVVVNGDLKEDKGLSEAGAASWIQRF
ncbi:MAG: hypothetical protein V1679_01805 [Candidatus Peregrinibacteria bacterium]